MSFSGECPICRVPWLLATACTGCDRLISKRFLDGEAIEEIGDDLGIPDEWVEDCIRRAYRGTAQGRPG